MNVAFAILLALLFEPPTALGQDAYVPPPAHAPELATSAATQPVSGAQLDGRLYWARFDAERAARQERLNSVDLKTPRVLTLSLLAPAAALLITAGAKALVELSTVTTHDDPFGKKASDDHNRFVNSCLAGAGGALAVAAIASGVWWGRRRAERNRLKRRLDRVFNETPLYSPLIALHARTGGADVVVRARF